MFILYIHTLKTILQHQIFSVFWLLWNVKSGIIFHKIHATPHCFLYRLIATMEWLSLLGLTLLSSHGKVFKYHEICVGSWLCSSIIHMLTSTFLESKCKRKHPLFKFRQFLTFLSFFGEITMVYLYFRHNNHCEPYMYSYFCLVEYSVIFMNMIYHCSALQFVEYPVQMIKSCTRHTTKTEMPSINNNPEQESLLPLA